MAAVLSTAVARPSSPGDDSEPEAAEAEAEVTEETSATGTTSSSGATDGAVASCRTVAFTVSLLLSILLSGGLIMGTSPFQSRLVAVCGFSESEAEGLIAGAFEIFVLWSALLAPLVDWVGPRLCATVGLCLEACCLAAIAHASEMPHFGLEVAVGLMGVGGNLMFYASIMCFPMLFHDPNTPSNSHDGLITNIMSAAYQISGFVFAILPHVDFMGFFRFYALLAVVGAAAALICYPNEPYTSKEDVPRFCQPLSVHSASCTNAGSTCSIWEVLRLPRTWLFLASYAMSATCGNWGLSIFYGVAEENEALIEWMPIIANSTFVFAPWIGALIDKHGFSLPALLLGLATLTFSLTIWLLPLGAQWLTLVALNLMMALVYGLQFTYLNKTYPLVHFGTMMSVSCFLQSAVNPLSLLWDSQERGKGALVFSVLTLPFCLLWACVQASLRPRDAEMVDAAPESNVESQLTLAASSSPVT